MTQKFKFVWIGVLWLAIIGGFIVSKQSVLMTGTEVLLKTVPVDPRDLFRGDYVVLSYDISTIDLNTVQTDFPYFEDPSAVNGKKIYVALDTQSGRGKVSGIFFKIPSSGLFIKGTIRRADGNRIRVEYGIESYFVPEGKGHEIETVRRDMDVKVAVDRSGNASIKSLWLNDKELTVK